ncbi:MAG: phosphoribosylanthranilate isomerase [Pseudomonadales bacterium]|nr:phosphoribosylanthranilate isomerase [Pseudomonadales bacterium]
MRDALGAVAAGCSAIGLNFYQNSRRRVSLASSEAIIGRIGREVKIVAVFVDPEVEEVVSVVEKLHVDYLQFHGDEPAKFCEQFQVPYLKAQSVVEGFDFEEFSDNYHRATALMLDSSTGRERGGTGTTFDWTLWPTSTTRKIILAGGLDATNVAQAIKSTNPWAVDVASGIEKGAGPAKDVQKMEAFMREVRRVGTKS